MHLAVVEVGDLGAEQIVLHLRVARGQHVADQQRPADRAVRLRDRRNRDPVHAPLQRPDVLGRLARQRRPDGRELRPHVLAVHRVDVEIARENLARRIEHRDDVGLRLAARAELAVDLLALLEGGLPPAVLVGLVERAHDRRAVRQLGHEVLELHRLQAGDVTVNPLGTRDGGVEVGNDRLPELAGDQGVDAPGERE